MPTSLSAELIQALAPKGAIRAAINFGNSVLAQEDPATGAARGISVDLARELERRTSLPLELVKFEAAGKVFDSIREDAWDVAFLAIDPVRATEILFTAPYVHIEGSYMVRLDSPIKQISDVDRPGIRVTVANKSAYDLFLSRSLRHAEIIRVPTGREALDLFLAQGIEVAAGVKGPLLRFAADKPFLRVIDDRFMVIEQAMGTRANREIAQRYLFEFVEEMKATGFVADALLRSGQLDAIVAPAAVASRNA